MPIIPVEKASLDVGMTPSYGGAGKIASQVATLGEQVSQATFNIYTQVKKDEADAEVSLRSAKDKLDIDDYYKRISYNSPDGYYHEEIRNERGEVTGLNPTKIPLSEHFKKWSEEKYKAGQDALSSAYAQEQYRNTMQPTFLAAQSTVLNKEYERREQNALAMRAQAFNTRKKMVFENAYTKDAVNSALQEHVTDVMSMQIPEMDKKKLINSGQSELAMQYYRGTLYNAERTMNLKEIERIRLEVLEKNVDPRDEERSKNKLPTAIKSLSSEDQQRLLNEIDSLLKTTQTKIDQNAKKEIDIALQNLEQGGSEVSFAQIAQRIPSVIKSPAEAADIAVRTGDAYVKGFSKNRPFVSLPKEERAKVRADVETNLNILTNKEKTGVIDTFAPGVSVGGIRKSWSNAVEAQVNQIDYETRKDVHASIVKNGANVGLEGDTIALTQELENQRWGLLAKDPAKFRTLLDNINQISLTANNVENKGGLAEPIARSMGAELNQMEPTQFANTYQAMRSNLGEETTSKLVERMIESGGLSKDYRALNAIASLNTTTVSEQFIPMFVASLKVDPYENLRGQDLETRKTNIASYENTVSDVMAKYYPAVISQNRNSTKNVEALLATQKAFVRQAILSGEIDGSSKKDIQKFIEKQAQQIFGTIDNVNGYQVLIPPTVPEAAINNFKANVYQTFYSVDGLKKLGITGLEGKDDFVIKNYMRHIKVTYGKDDNGAYYVQGRVLFPIAGVQFSTPTGHDTIITRKEVINGQTRLVPIRLPLSQFMLPPAKADTKTPMRSRGIGWPLEMENINGGF